MRLIFIRHGKPDYSIDHLTEEGWREANALAERAKNWNVDRIYVSPLGRAKDTAEPTLKALGMEAIECDWLREFSPRMVDPATGIEHSAWDLQPQDYTADIRMMHPDDWYKYGPYEGLTELEAEWKRVCAGIDSVIAEYGYHRNPENPHYFDFVDPTGHVNPAEAEDIMLRGITEYQVRDEDDEKTVLLFCHLGITMALVSHLIGVSPVALWHGAAVPPTGLTILNAEKRLHNTAHWRMQAMGDVSHLLQAGVPVSTYACFSPVFQG